MNRSAAKPRAPYQRPLADRLNACDELLEFARGVLMSWSARESEHVVDQTMWQAIEFRDGLLRRFAFCRTAEEALEAVGLRE